MSDADDDVPSFLRGESYTLVVPFVVCASAGGPHEDTAFVAGYSMGFLSHCLSTLKLGGSTGIVWKPGLPFGRELIEQIDLIAMAAGFTCEEVDPEFDEDTEEPDDPGWRAEWAYMQFRSVAEP